MAAAKKLAPTDPRPCRDCGDPIFLAYSVTSQKWRPFQAFQADDLLRPFAYVLVGTQAWRRGDLLEHWLVTRETSEEKVRALVDDYPHHLLHIHERDDEDNT